METQHGEASHRLATPEVDLVVTARGGHLAPVVFHLPGGDCSPYALAPWLPAEFPDQPVLLSVLRGDFFCLPFGGQENGPPHGDPANGEWTLEKSSSARDLRMSISTRDSGAQVEKRLSIRAGQHGVFIEHRVAGLEGEFNYGTHPILDLSGLPEGAARVTVSPFRWASVFPGLFSNPEAGEQQCLKGGARFTDLREVPLANGGITDLTRYPARPGNDDLVMMVSEPSTPAQPFAWSAVAMGQNVWFSLKDPADFPSTMFWLSNGGRSAAPWNSRHTGRLGVEDVCSYFANGVDASRQHPLAAEGIPTTRLFSRGEVTVLRNIQAMAELPDGFGAVASIAPAGPGKVVITGENGHSRELPLDWQWLTEPAG